MDWSLEEKTEDAIVSLLEANIDDSEVEIHAAWDWDGDDLGYPAAIVNASTAEPVSEPAEWHDPRLFNVSVAVMTEAAPLTDDDGNELVSIRQRNIDARTKVMDVLFKTTLLTDLIARGIEDVAFSMAQVTTTERSTEDRKLITTINLEVIAEPVTGS